MVKNGGGKKQGKQITIIADSRKIEGGDKERGYTRTNSY